MQCNNIKTVNLLELSLKDALKATKEISKKTKFQLALKTYSDIGDMHSPFMSIAGKFDSRSSTV